MSANTRRYFLYNAPTPSLAIGNGVFEVDEAAGILVAADMAGDTAPLQVRIGQTTDEFIWGPLIRDGSQVSLSATNNQHVELVPGTYRIDPAFAGAAAQIWFEELSTSNPLQKMLRYEVQSA